MTKYKEKKPEKETVILNTKKSFKNSLSQNEPISKLCDLKHT